MVKSYKMVLAALSAMVFLSILCGEAFAAPFKNASKSKAATRSTVAKPETTFTEIWAGRKPAFDSGKVRRYYLDGDFDEAIEILEAAIKENRNFNHADSVFFCKHLGVMYAAKYETREKGKYYMHLLLLVEPTARILDMYASDMIYMIFKNIQDEFESSQRKLVHADSALGGGHGARKPVSANEPKQGSSSTLWIGTAVTVAVAAGVASYFYFSDEPKISKINHTP